MNGLLGTKHFSRPLFLTCMLSKIHLSPLVLIKVPLLNIIICQINLYFKYLLDIIMCPAPNVTVITERTVMSGMVERAADHSLHGEVQPKETKSTPTSPNLYRPRQPRESPIIRLALFPRLEKCLSEPEVWNDKVPEVKDGAANDKVENSCSGSRSEGHISHMSEVGLMLHSS